MADFSDLKYMQVRASNFLGRGHANRWDGDPVPRVELVESLPESIGELWISNISNHALGVYYAGIGWVGFGFWERGRFGRLKRIDIEGIKWLKEGEGEGGGVGAA